MTRTFDDKPAQRAEVPLLVGLMGPSGGGKTFSALRLARGIQEVTGGDIFGIDTEARRMLHYADHFKFRHMAFGAPFGSEDYLAAIEHAVAKGGRVVIVDSMSHEHEGEGGLLDAHDKELTRMAGQDHRKRESMNMLAWAKPKAARQRLLNRLLQMDANFILCFPAKDTVKPVKVNNKTEIVPQGWMPIGGRDFVYDLTVSALLLPGANGVPTWRSEFPGERAMTKLPEQFRGLFAETRALDEGIGRELATWAKGGAVAAAATSQRPASKLATVAAEKADQGRAVFEEWWGRCSDEQRSALEDRFGDELWQRAGEADRAGVEAVDDEMVPA